MGREWDTDDLAGDFAPRIADGWYSAVVAAPSGRAVVWRKFAPAIDEDPDQEPLFVVSWDSASRGVAPCEVTPITFGEIAIHVVDDSGEAVADAVVTGCGRQATTDADGVAALTDAVASEPCTVHAFTLRYTEKQGCSGETAVSAAATDATVGMACVDTRDPEADAFLFGEAPSDEEMEARVLSELAVLRGVAQQDLGDPGNALVDELVDEYERTLDAVARFEALAAFYEAQAERVAWLADAIERATDPDEREALLRQLWSLPAE